LKYSEIKKDIESGQFPIVSYSEWFDSLERQGVLFLNTTFTCQAGKPNSHKNIWADFTKDLLQYISSKNPCIHWFLWGSEAQKNEKLISEGIFHKSRHPMMCSQKYEDDFLKSKCFENTWHLINWLG
jgi:uracil-DNA glycosylase